MLREFVDLVNEVVDSGYEFGLQLFVESLETDISKNEVISENGVDATVKFLFEQAGYEVLEETEEQSE